jgi:recombination protein RecA
MAPPFKKVEVDLLFDQGISKELDLLDAAIHYNVIEKSGAWLLFDGANIAQGREQAIQVLREDSVIADAVLGKIQAARLLRNA